MLLEITDTNITIRLFLSLLLGGLIGLERESHKRPAGFRTHILVCLGSTLVMLISLYGFSEFTRWTNFSRDPARLAAQVVSGIGFLGAGTILREGTSVKGLTTAASLWTVAAIGLAVGAGFYFAAVFTTALVLLTLLVLDKIEHRWLLTKDYDHLVVSVSDHPGQLGNIATVLGNYGIKITNVEITPSIEGNTIVHLIVAVPSNTKKEVLLEEIYNIDGIITARYNEGED